MGILDNRNTLYARLINQRRANDQQRQQYQMFESQQAEQRKQQGFQMMQQELDRTFKKQEADRKYELALLGQMGQNEQYHQDMAMKVAQMDPQAQATWKASVGAGRAERESLQAERDWKLTDTKFKQGLMQQRQEAVQGLRNTGNLDVAETNIEGRQQGDWNKHKYTEDELRLKYSLMKDLQKEMAEFKLTVNMNDEVSKNIFATLSGHASIFAKMYGSSLMPKFRTKVDILTKLKSEAMRLFASGLKGQALAMALTESAVKLGGLEFLQPPPADQGTGLTPEDLASEDAVRNNPTGRPPGLLGRQ